MNVRTWSVKLVAVALVVITQASPSGADFQIGSSDFRFRAENGGTSQGVVVSDGGSGDGNAASGVILYSGSVSDFSITAGHGAKTPALVVSGAHDAIELSNLALSANGAMTVVLYLQAKDLSTAPNGPLALVSGVTGELTAPAGSTTTFESWASASNGMPNLGLDIGPPADTLMPVGALPSDAGGAPGMTFGPGTFSGSTSTTFDKTGLKYALFSKVTITFTGAGTVNFNHMTSSESATQTTSTQPAPAGVALLAAGLPSLAFGYHRRRRAAQSA